ncbi:MAG: ATP synthase subunit I [Acidobacteriia bacterium]|nr:ATP synthase subunit I [Terriglobia bacterium]
MMDLAQAEARLPRWMVGLACAVTMGILLFGHGRFGAGFALGSALAILNYFWLHQAVEALMSAGQARPAKRVLAKFFVRYPLAFVAVYLFYKTGWLPAAAILAGLFVPAGGVLIEAVVLLRDGLKIQG